MNNPTIRAARANVRAIDERVNQALAGWRPTITSSGDYTYSRTYSRPGANVKSHQKGFSITANQPLFRGFRTLNSTRQADANVYAARQNLINTEQTVLLEVVTAFMNVVRDHAIVTLRVKNVAVLREQLRASRIRLRVGEITRTDVAQSRARLSGTVSALALARANLVSSRAEYARVVGRTPGTLRRKQSIKKMLPKRFETALGRARRHHPVLLSARFIEKASRHAVHVAKGTLLPELSLDGNYSRRYNRNRNFANTETENGSLIARLTVPLYRGGAEYSRIREAKQINSQRRLQIIEADRRISAEVIAAWEALRASNLSIRSDFTRMSANRLALSGVREEARVGSRTTLDVLDAEQELLDAHVALFTSKRNQIVAQYRLLAAMGYLTARKLRLTARIYNPVKHHKKVRHKWIGLGPYLPKSPKYYGPLKPKR